MATSPALEPLFVMFVALALARGITVVRFRWHESSRAAAEARRAATEADAAELQLALLTAAAVSALQKESIRNVKSASNV